MNEPRIHQNSPLATGLDDLVTPAQLVTIRRTAAKSSTMSEAACLNKFQCGIDELNRTAADQLIEYLSILAEPLSATKDFTESIY